MIREIRKIRGASFSTLGWNILINEAPPNSRLGEFYIRSITAQNETSPVWREVVTKRDTGFPRFDQHLWFDAQTSHPVLRQ